MLVNTIAGAAVLAAVCLGAELHAADTADTVVVGEIDASPPGAARWAAGRAWD